jgi:hypothetical protein
VRKHAKKLSVLGASLAVFLIGSVVFAAWLVTGTGNGAAQADTADALVVTAGSTSAQLYPGGSGDVTLSVQNPNPFPVDITSIVRSGAIDSSGPAACDASTGVSFTDQNSVTGMSIAAGATLPVTLTGAAAMDNSSDNSCQGQTFSIPLTVSGQSS